MATLEELQEISMEGFQVVSGDMFRHVSRLNAPTVTLWYNSISFSKAALVALNSCERVRIEVNAKTRCILLVPVTVKDKDGIRWMKTGKAPQARRLECKAFTSQLYEQWGWKEDFVYRTVGRIVTADNKVMLLFNFSDPENWKFNEKAKAQKNE